jgi:type IV pilus secretin PilQ/predicted competence protein
MRMRFVRNTGLVATKKNNCRAWSLLWLLLLLPALSHPGVAQDTAPGLKPAKGGDTLDVPYLGNKEAMEKLSKAPAGFISDVTTTQEGGSLAVSIASSRQLTYQEFSLNNPSRLVVDFFGAENRAPILNFPLSAAGVKRLRVRQFQYTDPKIARLVFDLDKNYGNHTIAVSDNNVRIVFHPADADEPNGTMPAASPVPASGSEAQKIPVLPPQVSGTSVSGMPSHPSQSTDAGTKRPASGAQSRPTPILEQKDLEDPVTIRPIISDLAVSEIPQSALATASAEPTVRVQPPPAKRTAPPPPPPVPMPVSATPVMALNPQPGNYTGHPLTLDLVNISLVDFFRLMAEEGGINIVMDPGVSGSLSIKVEKVPWDQIFEAALTNNALEKQVDGNLVRVATKKTLQTEAKQREDLKKANLLAADLETRIRRLNYAKAAALGATLKDQITVRGTIVIEERSGSLVITDIPNSLDKVMRLIDELDTPEPQVEIEARIVSANRDFARDIGVQFGFVQGNLERVSVGGPNTFGTIGGTRPSSTPKNTYAGGNSLTGRGASESSSTESGGTSAGSSATNNPGNFNVNLPSLKPFGGLGLSVGNIFDTFLLDAAITAGESKGQAKLISQPKLITQNNSPGMITQGLRFPVQVIANQTVTVQFQNAALTLTVTPQITSEGNIVLDLKVENNTPDFTRQVQGIPSIRTSESTTRVLVSDGGTTVIGGILIDNEQNQVDGVPGLSSLPIFGNLFKRTSVSHNTQEVLFFVTPRIVK